MKKNRYLSYRTFVNNARRVVLKAMRKEKGLRLCNWICNECPFPKRTEEIRYVQIP